MYVFDPFQSVAAGSGTPAGWTGPSFGSGTVEAFASAGGGAFTPHQWFLFSGNNFQAPSFTPVAAVTAWFAFKGEGASLAGQIMSMVSPRLPATTVETLIMEVEQDHTVSLYVGPKGPATLIGNTGSVNLALHPGVWYFFQVNVTLGLQNVSGVMRLKATADLVIDGDLVINNQSQISSFFIDTDFPSSTPTIEIVQWFQPNGGGNAGLAEPYIGANVGAGVTAFPGNLWDFTITNPGTGYTAATVTPSAGTATLTGVVSGGSLTGVLPVSPGFLGDSYVVAPTLVVAGDGMNAAATANLAPSPFRRMAQSVVEPAELPTTANIRIPQMVIEVATKSGPPPAVPVIPAPTGGGGRYIFAPTFCQIPPPGKPKYKGCGSKPGWCGIPEREWVDMPYGGIAFNPQKAILLPAPVDGDVVVFSFTVPIGYDGMVLGQYNTLTANFVQGAGDIVWRIRANGRYLRDRGNILVSIGTTRRLYPVVGGLQLFSGNIVEFLVNAPNVSGLLPAPGSCYVAVGLHGWFYPRK